MTDVAPLDADELMNFAERIESLPAADAEWVGRLFEECVRARLHEAELLAGDGDAVPAPDEETLAQVALDAAEWLKTLWDVGYMGAGSFPAAPRSEFPLVSLEDVLKSSLFARIRKGKRPLPFAPPTRQGLPWHDLVEDVTARHPVVAELARDTNGKAIGAVIEGCAAWHLCQEIVPEAEYLVQHRGKGPRYRLRFGPVETTLQREAPRFSFRICKEERGGFVSYTLEWLRDDGSVTPVALRAATWERAESEADYWVATRYPEMYGQIRFEHVNG